MKLGKDSAGIGLCETLTLHNTFRTGPRHTQPDQWDQMPPHAVRPPQEEPRTEGYSSTQSTPG